MMKFVSLDAVDVTVESQILGEFATVTCLGAKKQSDIPDSIADADVVALWHSVDMDAALLAKLRKCKMIVRMGVGYDNVDTAEAARLGIPVCNVPNYGTEEVADSALSHILNLFRRTATLAMRIAAGEGAEMKGPGAIAKAAGPSCRRIRGRTLGLVGCGRAFRSLRLFDLFSALLTIALCLVLMTTCLLPQVSAAPSRCALKSSACASLCSIRGCATAQIKRSELNASTRSTLCFAPRTAYRFTATQTRRRAA